MSAQGSVAVQQLKLGDRTESLTPVVLHKAQPGSVTNDAIVVTKWETKKDSIPLTARYFIICIMGEIVIIFFTI